MNIKSSPAIKRTLLLLMRYYYHQWRSRGGGNWSRAPRGSHTFLVN